MLLIATFILLITRLISVKLLVKYRINKTSNPKNALKNKNLKAFPLLAAIINIDNKYSVNVIIIKHFKNSIKSPYRLYEIKKV